MTAHIQIVGFNNRTALAGCLRACLAQTVRVPVLYLDNASSDGSADMVAKAFPEVRVIRNASNRGYSGGHNDALRAVANTDVVLVLNPDVTVEPDFVERGLAAFTRPSIGAIVPLLLRRGRKRGDDTPVVDAYGTRLISTLRAINQYEGIPVSHAPHPLPQPWGFTGAAAFLRRRAMEDVALDGEVFDEDLFTYREDVDLSWRLRLRGWEIVGAPDARATHVRAARTGGAKSPRVAQLSWRNASLVLVKNVPMATLIRHAHWVTAEHSARKLQLLFSPARWPALAELIRLLPRFLQKRRAVLSRASGAPYAAGDQARAVTKFSDGRLNFRAALSAPVLSCVVRRGDDILLLKRSERVSAYPGRWHIIGGYLDEPSRSSSEQALVELEEEVGIAREHVASVSMGEPFEAFDPDYAKLWKIHPIIVNLRGSPPVRLNWEHTDYRWVRPEDIASCRPIPTVPEVLRRLSVKHAPQSFSE